MRTKYAIRVAYDGTDFCGWQTQNGVGEKANPKPSIEETLIAAIRDLTDEVVTVTGSGRTDGGVHGSGQVAHLRLETLRFSEEHLRLGLNHRLPGSVRIISLETVRDDFHAGRAIAKQYSYYFQVGPANLPHPQRYTTWYREPLDQALIAPSGPSPGGNPRFRALCRRGLGNQVDGAGGVRGRGHPRGPGLSRLCLSGRGRAAFPDPGFGILKADGAPPRRDLERSAKEDDLLMISPHSCTGGSVPERARPRRRVASGSSGSGMRNRSKGGPEKNVPACRIGLMRF